MYAALPGNDAKYDKLRRKARLLGKQAATLKKWTSLT